MSELARRLQSRKPKTAIILGSSLGSIADAVKDPLVIPYGELPGFPVPKISGHAGKLVVGKLGGKEVAVLAGRAHPYESGNAAVMRPVIAALKDAGIETLVLTNAAGSLKPEMRPGAIMLITDHINYSGMNPLIGQHGDENFVPMTDAYDPALRDRMLRRPPTRSCTCIRASTAGIPVRASRRRPRFACSRSSAARRWACRRCPRPSWRGATACSVAALSVITNLAAGIEGASPSHEETKREGAKAADNMSRILARFCADA